MASRSCCGSDGQADARPACLSPGAAAAHTVRHAVHLCTHSMKDQQPVCLTGNTHCHSATKLVRRVMR
jgi:hypothetical protein